MPLPGFGARGADIDGNGVVWVSLASGHLGSFDRRKCKGPLNGPKATGDHCPEGWSFHQYPGPGFEGIGENSAESSYYTWVDQHDTFGLGRNVPLSTGNLNDGLIAYANGRMVVLRVPYPLGFYAKGLDGRIDDPNGGWKGRGLWAANGDRTPWLIEGGKGTAAGRAFPAAAGSAGEVALRVSSGGAGAHWTTAMERLLSNDGQSELAVSGPASLAAFTAGASVSGTSVIAITASARTRVTGFDFRHPFFGDDGVLRIRRGGLGPGYRDRRDHASARTRYCRHSMFTRRSSATSPGSNGDAVLLDGVRRLICWCPETLPGILVDSDCPDQRGRLETQMSVWTVIRRRDHPSAPGTTDVASAQFVVGASGAPVTSGPSHRHIARSGGGSAGRSVPGGRRLGIQGGTLLSFRPQYRVLLREQAAETRVGYGFVASRGRERTALSRADEPAHRGFRLRCSMTTALAPRQVREQRGASGSIGVGADLLSTSAAEKDLGDGSHACAAQRQRSRSTCRSAGAGGYRSHRGVRLRRRR